MPEPGGPLPPPPFQYLADQLTPGALKPFCFVSVSVFLPKQIPVSVKLPFSQEPFRLSYLFHIDFRLSHLFQIDCFSSVTLFIFASFQCILGFEI